MLRLPFYNLKTAAGLSLLTKVREISSCLFSPETGKGLSKNRNIGCRDKQKLSHRLQLFEYAAVIVHGNGHFFRAPVLPDRPGYAGLLQ